MARRSYLVQCFAAVDIAVVYIVTVGTIAKAVVAKAIVADGIVAKALSMFAILRQRRLRWLGHVHRLISSQLPCTILYGKLLSGERAVGQLRLHFKDEQPIKEVCFIQPSHAFSKPSLI